MELILHGMSGRNLMQALMQIYFHMEIDKIDNAEAKILMPYI